MTCIDYHSHFPYFQKEFRTANLNKFEVKPMSEKKSPKLAVRSAPLTFFALGWISWAEMEQHNIVIFDQQELRFSIRWMVNDV